MEIQIKKSLNMPSCSPPPEKYCKIEYRSQGCTPYTKEWSIFLKVISTLDKITHQQDSHQHYTERTLFTLFPKEDGIFIDYGTNIIYEPKNYI